MNESRIDISEFTRVAGPSHPLTLLVTVKNFDLQAIRARYLASKESGKGRTGSVERRPVADGGLVRFDISETGVLTNQVIKRLKEPRGIAQHGEQLAFSSEKEVILVGPSEVKTLKDPWFSYIHTVDFNAKGDRILVSSSGFDAIMEYDTEGFRKTYEWWAWEHGFHKGIDPETGAPVRLSRVPLPKEESVKVISDPERDVLPTAMRAAFINSVEYDRHDEQHMLATFFHEGSCYRIDRTDGSAELVISGMKNPHGGTSIPNGYMATSTRSGEVMIVTEGREDVLSFQSVPGKPTGLESEEWLQNTKAMDDGSIITIDSNRTSFIIINPSAKTYAVIPYPDHMAIQDLIISSKEIIDRWTAALESP